MKFSSAVLFTLGLIFGLAQVASAQNLVVVTAPLAAPGAAPALSASMLVVLAVLLGVTAVYAMRRRSAGSISMLIGVALTGTVAIAYAQGALITLQGPDCSEKSVHPYDPNQPSTTLVNACPNPMQVVELDVPNCGEDIVGLQKAPVQGCMEGAILNTSDECSLPNCS